MRLVAMLCAVSTFACTVIHSAADAAAQRAAGNAVDNAMSGPSAAGPSASRSRAPGEDEHGLVADDWFVADEAYRSGWIYVKLAKQMIAPTEGTKAEGEYMLIDGQKIWTKYYYRTRPATKDDLRLGAIVIVFDRSDGCCYEPPKDRDNARSTAWWMGTVTDLTDLFKNEVAVGEFKVRPEAMRVIVAGQ